MFDLGDDAVAAAFQNGIERLNNERAIARQSVLRNLTMLVPPHDSFSASKRGEVMINIRLEVSV